MRSLQLVLNLCHRDADAWCMEHTSDVDLALFEAFLGTSDSGESRLLAELLGIDEVVAGAPHERSLLDPEVLLVGDRRRSAA